MLRRKTPARTRRRHVALWQVLELLNNHLGAFPQGRLFIREHIVIETYGFITRQRYSRREDVLRNDSRLGRRAGGGLEMHTAWLPAERVGHGTRRVREAHDVRGDVVGLNDILRILAFQFTPTSDLDVDFARRSSIIPCCDGEDRSRFQARNITHNKRIGAIAETRGETNLCAGPRLPFPHDAEMKKPILIDPCVCGIVKICGATCVAGGVSKAPFIPAEQERLQGCTLQGVLIGDSNGANVPAFLRQVVESRVRVVPRIDEKSRISIAGMRLAGPGAVRKDVGEGFFLEWLHPPDSAAGVQDDLLVRSRTRHPSCDVVKYCMAAISSNGKMSEFNRRLDTRLLRRATCYYQAE